MPRRARRTTKRALRRSTLRRLASRLLWALLIVAAATAGLVLFSALRQEPPPSTVGVPSATDTAPAATISATRRPTLPPGTPPPTATSTGKRVGILAGHSGPQNDPGAVCPDGLREVDISLAVAERVVAALLRRGYEVDLLSEYDERLSGYLADAMLSIHADSCEVPEASGFKVAHVAQSAIPETEDVLVECLYEEYERSTGLTRHDSSITPAMHGYHAFLEIDPQTPGAIIELGFMDADRNLLVNRPDLMANGIVAGLICFLER